MLRRFVCMCGPDVRSTLNGISLYPKMTISHHLSTQSFRSFNEHKPTNNQTIYISEILRINKEYSPSEWEEIFKLILEKGNYVTPYNITAVIIGFCTTNNQFNVATSLMRYLQEKKQSINIATLSKYLRLCYESWPQSGENVVINTFKELSSKIPIMDANTAENAAIALSRTSQWRTSIDLLDTIKLTCSPNNIVYNSLIESAFNNNHSDLGWSLAKDAMIRGRKLQPKVYHAWMNYCKNHNEEFERLLDFIIDHSITPSLEPIQSILQYVNSLSTWKGSLAEVNQKGICNSCRNKLQDIQLSHQQFKTLQSQFLKQVVLGRDVFTKSTPAEIGAFQKFLKDSYPYDVVIDGLNVGYATGAAGKNSNKVRSAAVKNVVEQFIKQGQSVLVLGRKHMLAWPKFELEYIRMNARLFLANDLSQDDPLLLYATLYGGPHTHFVSKDLMKSHAFNLEDPELSQLFRRWQQWRQYTLSASKFTSRVKVFPPIQFVPTAQKALDKENTLWHIPYQEVIDDSTVILDVPRTWLCLKQIIKIPET